MNTPTAAIVMQVEMGKIWSKHLKPFLKWGLGEEKPVADIEAMAQVGRVDCPQKFNQWCRLCVKDVFQAEQYVGILGTFNQVRPEFKGIIQPCLRRASVAPGIVSRVKNNSGSADIYCKIECLMKTTRGDCLDIRIA